MTNRDVFTQILSEASGRPLDEVKDLVDKLVRSMGSRHHLDEEISDDEAQAQLTQLRRELPGIRRWLVQGGIEAREIIRDAARYN